MMMENMGKQDPMVNSEISGDWKIFHLLFKILTLLTKKVLNFNCTFSCICNLDIIDLKT